MMLRLALAIALMGTTALAQDSALEAMQDYADFATYDAGIIRPEQITQDIFASLYFIDTRQASEFEQGTVPGAVNIEWRAIFGEVDAIPTDQKVVLFCNTGVLSAQAAFGLRVAGLENVVVLQSGYQGWLAQMDASQ